MIQLTLTSGTYNVPTMLKEITIAQALEVERIYDTCPESVIRSWSDPKTEVWSTDAEAERIALCAIAEVLSGAPREELAALPAATTAQLLNIIRLAFVAQIVFGIFDTNEVEQIEHFDFEGERYYMPISERDVNGEQTPLAAERALTWAQATDLMIAQKDGHRYMPLIIAILCRPKGEEYDEHTAKRRAEAFINLPANVMVELFFCCNALSNIYRLCTLGALAKARRDQEQQTAEEAQR